MPLQNRKSLKEYFRKGQLPSEGHFHDLIDSTINKVDDGMSKTMEDGLMLSPIGESQKLISFFKSIEDKFPVWRMAVDKNNAGLNFSNKLGDSVLTICEEGKIGVNNESPEFAMDVDGHVSMSGRTGNAFRGRIPADGKWHEIVSGLNGCELFEVVAGVGKKKTGKYALLHAIAICTFGKSKNKIHTTQAYYGVRGNRIKLRWTGTTYNYNLEMRTRYDYGDNTAINFNIQRLWQDTFMDKSLLEENEKNNQE